MRLLTRVLGAAQRVAGTRRHVGDVEVERESVPPPGHQIRGSVVEGCARSGRDRPERGARAMSTAALKKAIDGGDVEGVRAIVARDPRVVSRAISWDEGCGGDASEPISYISLAQFHGLSDHDRMGEIAGVLLVCGAPVEGAAGRGDPDRHRRQLQRGWRRPCARPSGRGPEWARPRRTRWHCPRTCGVLRQPGSR